MDFKKLTAQARGVIKADFVIKNALIPNVFSYEIENGDIAISDGIIVGVGSDYNGEKELNADGKYIVPGFIEGHCHIESTMLTPQGFAELVIPHGTTTVFADPHEIANTSSLEGLHAMHNATKDLPIDIYLNAPSCVPASPFETPKEPLYADSLKKAIEDKTCYALGEMMNWPGVIYGDTDTWEKILASKDIPCNGHAPCIMGKDLNAYMLSRCNSDHECSTLSEAEDKLRRGSWVMLRQGATEHNLKDLAPLIVKDERRASRCMLVSDDLTIDVLYHEGHLDRILRLAVKYGISPITALRMVTLNTAEFNRMYDRGAIAPGYRADMLMLNDLSNFNVLKVWKDGKEVIVPEVGFKRTHDWPGVSCNNQEITLDDLHVSYVDGKKLRAIQIIPGQVVTKEAIVDGETLNGTYVASVEKDLAKMCVINRNTPEKRVGLGFITGLGLKHGAIGQSVAHDAHNFSIAGMDDESILTAYEALREKGGAVVTDGKKVLFHLPLPIAGLMSDKSAVDLLNEFTKVITAAKSLGTPLPNPYMVMSFLSLSVIPQLKLTDQGYVDLARGGIMPLLI